MVSSPAPDARAAGLFRARRAAMRRFGEVAFSTSSLVFALIVVAIIVMVGYRLYADSALTRHRYGLGFLTSSLWDVQHQVYGALPVIVGTLITSSLALLIAVPISVGAGLFLTEIAPKWLSGTLGFMIEMLAAIPSVIFGLWGFLVLCPFIQAHVSPWLVDHLGANPIFGGPSTLNNILCAGIILAVMILPIITAITREVLLTIPAGQREASVGLGATKWETIKNVLLRQAKGGITGAVILGLGRAFGETMAVVMVIGNNSQLSASILKQGYTMPALLANQFNEAFSDDLQRSALLEIALVLFLVTVVVNGLARGALLITTRELAHRTRPVHPIAARLNAAFDAVASVALASLAGALVAIQLYFDFRARGPAAFGGPVEIVLLAGIALRIISARLSLTSLLARWRRIVNVGMQVVLCGAATFACVMLGAVLAYVAIQGVRGLSLNLFTQLPRPPGVLGGGLKNAILGTVELVAIAGAIGIPIGLMGGIYVAEFGRNRFGAGIRFAADVLNGIPSVVIGLFGYAAFVLPFHHFSGWAGAGALAIMMIPTVLRTTEEMLKLVPNEFRAAAFALGAGKAYTVRTVILPAARSGILTGIMLATARIAGETAPLLFTAFGNDEFVSNPSEPTSTLTMKIFSYAQSAYDDQVGQAWAGALILVLLILGLSLLARFSRRRTLAHA
ncbi:MAG TPA: phosphate ABC transporter permease subunit PstC [Fimbriimonadaceae bacterium]|nr:phosphate ABC transporter permease subunit PstC [Fimbriimonadaceae bacterium]